MTRQCKDCKKWVWVDIFNNTTDRCIACEEEKEAEAEKERLKWE